MSDIDNEEIPIFPEEEIEKKIIEEIESNLNNVHYEDNKVIQIQNKLSENILKTLIDFKKNFKYIIQTTIIQKTGGAFLSFNSQIWDAINDYSLTVHWPKEKQKENYNKSLCCIVNVFAIDFN